MSGSTAWNIVGNRVTAHTASGAVHSEGVVVAYYHDPAVAIRRDDGSMFTWSAHMCRQAHEDDATVLAHEDDATVLARLLTTEPRT